MIHSFSVIVPVLNKEKEITRTLESIEASIQFFQCHWDSSHSINPEVIIVDEGSTDRTLEQIENFTQDKPHYRLIKHTRSLGAGAARNTGVKLSQGEVLFYCDGDDLFFKEHIYCCFSLINYDPSVAQSASIHLAFDSTTYTISPPAYPVGMVSTGVYMRDSLHPYWKEAIENSLPLNLCVRRECHEFIEGFPEASVYKQIGGCEDISYRLWLSRFFRSCKINIETVEYIRYPGNNFDKQLKKFQSPPDQQAPIPNEELKLHQIRQKLEEERYLYLLEKFSKLNKPDFSPLILNWLKLANTYLAQQRYADAITLFEQGIAIEPETLPSIKNHLAMAYNNFGTMLHDQKDLQRAAEYLQKAITLQPDYAPKELAGVYFNTGNILKDLGQFEQALPYFRWAIEINPDFPQAKTEIGRIQYKAKTQAKGYLFTQDWFSHNIPIWEHYLAPFINQPGLKALEIGSWEGRSTCWLLDNILTHESATITCVDTFEGSIEHNDLPDDVDRHAIEARFDFNIAQTNASEKVIKLVGKSRDILRFLTTNSYHFAYIDGSHIASDVLEDTLFTWSLIKVGGIIIFDDYGFNFSADILELPPRVAIDSFLTVFAKKVKLLHRGYQVLVEKIAD
ncbi:MAG: glycosyltransferase [Cyanobacteria bacterium CRU_2_1]|nr:glycosyltransferase [Cyanobacteria bacterium RU_5_0]NJR60901.1 glycosyltransferase [Cyanobacteria bacterium CRU_2_1]